jgi:hypothetical protein
MQTGSGGITEPPTQWVSVALSLGVKAGGGVKLTTHFHLVPRLRMRGAIPLLPNMPSWRDAQLKHRDIFTFYLEPTIVV